MENKIIFSSLTTGVQFEATKLQPIENELGFFTAYCEELDSVVTLFADASGNLYLDNNQ